MAALGFEQASVLYGLMQDSTGEVNAAVTELGAAFNAAIAVLDYLVDESTEAKQLFDVLNHDVVRGIFEATSESETALAAAYARATDPRLRLLFALVATCAAEGRALHRSTGNDPAWARLAQVVGSIYEAERSLSYVASASREEMSGLLPAVEAKSRLPSVVTLWISTLATTQREASTGAQHAAANLGSIFLLIDDLVDLLVDCRRRAPNTVVLRLAEMLAEQGRTQASDTDVYDVVDAMTLELLRFLQPDSFMPVSSESSKNRDAGDLLSERSVSHEAMAAVRDFARLTVAGWTRWEEDNIEIMSAPPRRYEGAAVAEGHAAGTRFLLAQQRDGFREAIHHLRFPRSYPDGIRYETHPALLSFRAVALDGLLDAYGAGLPVPRRVLDAEAIALLRAKHRYVRGGWSYITHVPELPPDADDLGQVLQALCRVGGPALASTCDEAIRLTLDAAEPEGGVPTWIVDPLGSSPVDYTMGAYLAVMGGTGVHPEVVANFMYGLILYDPARYHGALSRSVPYFESVQDERGAWSSKWYSGPYYGTYRAMLVLGHLTPGSQALNSARAFLLNNQHLDGGWGDYGSNPLSTAFAVLALSAPGIEVEKTAIARGVDYLLRTQEVDGGWPAHAWITFPWTEANWSNGSNVGGVVTYGSRTMTTTFSVKALLASAPAIGLRRSKSGWDTGKDE